MSLSYIRAPPYRQTHTPTKGSHHGNRRGKKTPKKITVRKRIQPEREEERERKVFNKLKTERV